MDMEDQYTFIDLFAGVGGLRLAMESAGGRCVYSNEWNKFSRQTYEANFGEVPGDDIKQVATCDVPDHDILVGEASVVRPVSRTRRKARCSSTCAESSRRRGLEHSSSRT